MQLGDGVHQLTAGALEVSLPVVQPKEFWEESGRWQFYGKELLRIKDRKNNEFCFAPTAEEMITDLARKNIKSKSELSGNALSALVS